MIRANNPHFRKRNGGYRAFHYIFLILYRRIKKDAVSISFAKVLNPISEKEMEFAFSK